MKNIEKKNTFLVTTLYALFIAVRKAYESISSKKKKKTVILLFKKNFFLLICTINLFFILFIKTDCN